MLPTQIDKIQAQSSNLLATTVTGTASADSVQSSGRNSISPPSSTQAKTFARTRTYASNKVIAFAGGGYMLCSSLMLFVNKIAIHNAQTPAFVLFCQLFFSWLFCFIFGRSFKQIRILASVEPYKWSKMKQFFPAVFAFLGTIFFNIKTLQYCHVETFIVFRASTPIFVSIGDYLFLGREFPSLRSFLCLIGLIIGVTIYTKNDHGFDIWGYRWLACWYIVFLFDQLYLKFLCDRNSMSNFARVYYLNGLSAVPLFFLFIFQQELSIFILSRDVFVPLFISCVLGIGMSYFAFYARALLSATSFTLLGNVCKILTVIINYLWWEKHANFIGISALLFCLCCAYFYQQAPMRKPNRTSMHHMSKV